MIEVYAAGKTLGVPLETMEAGLQGPSKQGSYLFTQNVEYL
jgi:hypothetical protein